MPYDRYRVVTARGVESYDTYAAALRNCPADGEVWNVTKYGVAVLLEKSTTGEENPK